MTVFSVMAVTSRRILRAATYLLFVLISTSVIYFQLGYEFLGAVQIAVYAGGIMVLFVFAILLTRKPGDMSAPLESHRRALGISISICRYRRRFWCGYRIRRLRTIVQLFDKSLACEYSLLEIIGKFQCVLRTCGDTEHAECATAQIIRILVEFTLLLAIGKLYHLGKITDSEYDIN